MIAVASPRRMARPRAASPETAADERWDPLIAIVVAYSFVAVGRIHQLFPVLEVLHPAMLTAGGALVLALMDNRRERRTGPVLRFPTVRWLFALLVWATLSIPGALFPGGAFETVFDRLIKAVLMAVVTVVAVRGKKDVERLAMGFFASVAIYAAVVLTRFDISVIRTKGLYYYDSNDYALLAVISLPFGVYALGFAKNHLLRALSAVGLLAIAVSFVWTGSRGGFLALGCTAVGGLFLLRTVPVRWRIIGVAALSSSIVLAANEDYWKRMETLDKIGYDYNVTEPSGRVQIWKRGVVYMFDHPFLGVGAGNFATAEGTLSPRAYLQKYNIGIKWSAAHNAFVQIGAELGFPGLFFFVAAIACSMLAVRRAGSEEVTRNRELRVLADLCSIGLCGFVVGAVFLSVAYDDVLYAMHGLAMSVVKASMLEAPRA
jgi:O-antigen ligase